MSCGDGKGEKVRGRIVRGRIVREGNLGKWGGIGQLIFSFKYSPSALK